MKIKTNKSILFVALALALVAVIAVGGTLAYLTAQTGPVTNTFVGSAGINMTLQEHKVNSETGKLLGTNETVQANSYTNIYPNKEVDKDPFITVTSAPQDGMDLFVKIAGVDQYMTVNGLDTSKWTKVDGDANSVNGIYKWNESVTLAAGETSKNFPVFTSVTFSNYTGTPTFSNIVVTSYAVQSKGMLEGDTTTSLAIAALNAAQG